MVSSLPHTLPLVPSVLSFKEEEILKEFLVSSMYPPVMACLLVVWRTGRRERGREGGRERGREGGREGGKEGKRQTI